MKRLLAATLLVTMFIVPAGVSARSLRLDAPETVSSNAPSPGERVKAAIDLFVLSDPPCEASDFRFIVTPLMTVAACEDLTLQDFAGMFLIDGTWRPGVYDTGR